MSIFRSVPVRLNVLHKDLTVREQDQMIILLALAAGRSTVCTGPLSLHTQYVLLYATLTLVLKREQNCDMGGGTANKRQIWSRTRQ